MGLSGEKAQNKTADTQLAATNTAINTAAQEDPALKQMREYWQSIADWDEGKKGPIDVHDLPGSGVDIGLFENAKAMRDAGRVGRGLGTAGENVNPAFTTALDKELESDRAIEASGALEDAVRRKVGEARAGLTGIGQNAEARNLNVAGLRGNLYSTYLNRPREKSALSQFLSGGLQAASGLGSAAIQSGGWAGLFAL